MTDDDLQVYIKRGLVLLDRTDGPYAQVNVTNHEAFRERYFLQKFLNAAHDEGWTFVSGWSRSNKDEDLLVFKRVEKSG